MRSAYYSRANSYSRSYNAIVAEREGRYPRTRAAKELGLSTKAFDAGCAYINYRSTEWHHVGKYANQVDYYDTQELGANPLLWKGAMNRANKELCNYHISMELQARIKSRCAIAMTPQVKFTYSGDCSNYALTLVVAYYADQNTCDRIEEIIEYLHKVSRES